MLGTTHPIQYSNQDFDEMQAICRDCRENPESYTSSPYKGSRVAIAAKAYLDGSGDGWELYRAVHELCHNLYE